MAYPGGHVFGILTRAIGVIGSTARAARTPRLARSADKARTACATGATRTTRATSAADTTGAVYTEPRFAPTHPILALSADAVEPRAARGEH